MSDEKKYGRTIFDLIAERPKPTLILIILLILIVLLILFLKIPFKIGSFEIGSKNQQKKDTVIFSKKDTIYVQKASELSSQHKQTILPENQIKPNKGLDTITTIKNHAANINTGINNGNIGNTAAKNVVNGTNNGINGDVTVNAENKISDADLLSIYNQVNDYITANGFEKGFSITREPNDNAPTVYNQIFNLFKNKGYAFLGFQNLFSDDRVVKKIGFAPLSDKKGVEILIGEF